MIHESPSLEHITDDDLFATVRRLTARSNVALADLLVHLGEIELRGLHRLRACASLYTYCVYELRMSEDTAFRRAKAARLVRQYPELRDAIAKGEIHLTGVLMIGPYLGGEHHVEVLRRARFRSKRELLRLIAEIDPKPAVPARVEPIGPAPAGRATQVAYVESLMGGVRELQEGARPADWIDESEREREMELTAAQSLEAQSVNDANDASVSAPGRALQYKVQFTASQEYVDLLEEAMALLGHEKPGAGLAEVQQRALEFLVAKLRKERGGESGTAPARDDRAADGTAPARALRSASCAKSRRRAVSRGVQRTVRVRDGARCAYVDERGVRCRETAGLELHHRCAHALGGPDTADNLELRCRAHNALAAEEDFGREHMERVRPSDPRVEG